MHKRLQSYFKEANKHIELIEEAYEVLSGKMPLQEYSHLSSLEKFAFNALIFRFSKLQDLIGAKIFRAYLDYSGFETASKTFFDILKEIEKENIIDIDTWDELRKLRNSIAHEYPQEEDEILESINLFLSKCDILIQTAKKLERNFHEIKRKRARDD